MSEKTPKPKKPKTHKSYRAIIRFSMDADEKSKIRNKVIKQLTKAGFTNTNKTGSWETPASDLIVIQSLVCEVMDKLSKVTNDDGEPMTLDHMC